MTTVEILGKDYPWRISEVFPGIKSNTLEKLETYAGHLVKFNKKINLVSSRSLDEMDLVHFVDSIYGCRFMLGDCQEKDILDIGSGNGFPGIVLGILDPDRTVILLDSDTRKLEFLRFVRSEMKLENVKILNSRLEDLAPTVVSAGISRAFAPLGKALLMARKAFKQGGVYYHIKGSEWTVEVTALPHQLCAAWNTVHVGSYKLKEKDSERAVLKSVRY
jgi:16S rRNA (guanine527-N7)-methyltransferase